MPRPTLLVFGKAPTPVAGKWHPLSVDDVVVENGHARVRLRHLDPELEGLAYVLERELPLNPLGPFGMLARACGLDVTEEMKIDPRELRGWTVKAQFTAAAAGAMAIVAFMPMNEETTHDSD